MQIKHSAVMGLLLAACAAGDTRKDYQTRTAIDSVVQATQHMSTLSLTSQHSFLVTEAGSLCRMRAMGLPLCYGVVSCCSCALIWTAVTLQDAWGNKIAFEFLYEERNERFYELRFYP